MNKPRTASTVADLEGAGLEEFDPVEYLTSDPAIAAYMTDIMAAGDMALLNSAIDDVVRARGVARIAQDAGMTREGLYKALRKDSKPRFETIAAVLDALGLAVKIVPKEMAEQDNSYTLGA